MDSVTPFVKGVEIMPDGSVVRSGTNYSGKFQEAHDASKASIQSRVSNLESGGVKGTGNREAEVPPAFKQEEFASTYESRFKQTPAETNSNVVLKGLEVSLYVP